MALAGPLTRFSRDSSKRETLNEEGALWSMDQLGGGPNDPELLHTTSRQSRQIMITAFFNRRLWSEILRNSKRGPAHEGIFR